MKNNVSTVELKKSKGKSDGKHDLARLIPFIGLIGSIVFFSIATGGRFLQADNITMLLSQSFVLIITALGSTFIYAHGAIDVSLGSVSMLSCILACMVAQTTNNGVLSFATCLVVCVLAALLIGVIACKLNIRPFPAALSLSFICQGISGELLTTGQIIMPKAIIEAVYQPWIMIVVLVVSFVVCYILFEHTKVGHINKAMGGNETTVKLSGINTDKYKLIAYTIRGVMLAIASFFLICRVAVVNTSTSSGLHIDVMLAVVLGGMSIRGGPKSNIFAPLIGAITTYVLNNGFILMGVDAYYVQFFKGIIFLIVILLVFEKERSGPLPD